jgi:putative colanic acid biosynthesis UDP-glucose lipid carrier transferase
MANRAIPQRASATLAFGRDNLLNLVEALLEPLAFVLSLWAVAAFRLGELPPSYLILSLIVFSLTFPGTARLRLSPLGAFWHILQEWGLIAFLLLLLGWATRFLQHFDAMVIMVWLFSAPAASIATHFLLRRLAPLVLDIQHEPRRTVIVGMNEQGLELGRRISTDRFSHMRLLGYFDDRDADRLAGFGEYPLLGKLDDLSAYLKETRAHLVFLSLPMSKQERILRLLATLRDTTASVHFVPDIHVTDLIQARMDQVCGIPVIAVVDDPFSGLNGFIKRTSDIVLSLLILLLIAPLLLVLAVAVKLSSPGPVIFRQRRYGLDGEEIVVYKFRSMTVCEDGDSIRQAQKNDQRITRLGAFMRKTSLDELPQFINVLQGRMSIVGPRPHAIAHNELYRKVIDGYMIRHKVKPGITGWAQVCGYRGETETLDKMKARIDHDLEYLRNWSLRLDLFIIFRTVWVILKGQNAY